MARRRPIGIRGARDDSPGLGDRVDPALVVDRRAERSPVVEEGAAIPVAVPAVAFERRLQGVRVLAPGEARAGLSALLGDAGELEEVGVEEPAEPDALALAARADAVHAVVPVSRAHERQSMAADREARDRAPARSARRATPSRPRPAGWK